MTAPPFEEKEETTVTTTEDGTTTTTTIKTRKLDTADIAVVAVFALCGAIFLMSIFVESLREAVSGALPLLIGVFTLAVGGFAAVTFLKKTESSV